MMRYFPEALVQASRELVACARIRRWLRALWQLRHRPPVGRVRFGGLRRVTPISREFGYDRGRPIDRYYIENFLARHAQDIQGHVLEIGDDSYTREFGGNRVSVGDVLHVSEGNPQATIIADLTRAEHVPSDAFDCIIFTQTLQCIYDTRSAIRTLYRILKPGGVLLATFPGISQMDQGEWGDYWCWSFTRLSIRRLFGEAFPEENLGVEAHGNVLTAVAFLHGLAVEELRPEELDYRDPSFDVSITLRAVKPEIYSDGELVTVAIPCYNQAHFLSEAIESVLAQSYPRFELIVVDDGSTDNTSEVAARYPRVRLIRQDNQGLAAARNTGLRQGKGDYLVFLDADDRLVSNALETGVRQLSSHPECAFVYGHYRFIAADGSPLPPPRQHLIDRDHYVELLRGANYIAMHAAVMYRRTVFDSVGDFDSSLRVCEDYELYLRIARQSSVYRHEKVVAEYRRHTENMTQDFALMLKTAIEVLRSQRPYILRDKRRKEAYKTGVRSWQDWYGVLLARKVWAHARQREWKRAVGDLLILTRYYPGVFARALRKLVSDMRSR